MEIIREYPAKLHGNSGPERESDNHPLLIVESVLDKNANTHHKENGHDHNEVRCHHRTRDGQHHRDQFGQEGNDQEQSSHAHANRPRCHPGDFGNRDTGRIGRVRHRTSKPREQIAQPVGIERALYRAKVHGPRSAPRGPLYCDGIPNCIERPHKCYHHERR